MSLRLDNTEPEKIFLERLSALSPDEFRRLHDRASRAARRAGLVYDGKTLPFSLMPVVVSERQQREVRAICNALVAVLVRIPEIYLQDREVRETLPLTPSEDEWLRGVWSGRRPIERCIARFDADWGTAAPDGVRRMVLFETNTVSIGGFHYAPALADVLREIVFPRVLTRAERRRLHHDTRAPDLLVRVLDRQRRDLGGGPRTMAVLEQDPGDDDWAEVGAMLQAFREAGWRTAYVDPRDLAVRDGVVTARGRRVEVFYRYVQLRDALALRGKAGRFDGFREAFRQSRIVPGLSGEFDHKSLWEILQSERFAQFFDPRLRTRFRSCIPWTRLLRERVTDGPYGRDVDLLPFVRRHQESLLLKPNRAFGGEGIVFGARVTKREWSAALDRAMSSRQGWVVQTWIVAHRKMVPYVSSGRLDPEPMYFTQGIFADGVDVSILSRLCPLPIVNVAQGGLTAPGFTWR